MFAKLLAALLGNLTNIAAEVDTAVTAYRADQNNAQKAHTVAKGVLSIVDTVAPVVEALIK